MQCPACKKDVIIVNKRFTTLDLTDSVEYDAQNDRLVYTNHINETITKTESKGFFCNNCNYKVAQDEESLIKWMTNDFIKCPKCNGTEMFVKELNTGFTTFHDKLTKIFDYGDVVTVCATCGKYLERNEEKEE